MKIKMIPAHSGNYTKGRVQNIQYIVVHYTANDGDTAKGNCTYFSSSGRNASAHYFVDENHVYQSVADKDTAWSVGASAYVHKRCRNSNSISVEMCSRMDTCGDYYIMEDTVSNTVQLVKNLMKQYNIDEKNVLRHYDVTGKQCPEPFVRDTNQWALFKRRLEEGEMDKASVKIHVNGTTKVLEGYNVAGTNYVAIRELCDLLGIVVAYHRDTKLITLKK